MSHKKPKARVKRARHLPQLRTLYCTLYTYRTREYSMACTILTAHQLCCYCLGAIITALGLFPSLVSKPPCTASSVIMPVCKSMPLFCTPQFLRFRFFVLVCFPSFFRCSPRINLDLKQSCQTQKILTRRTHHPELAVPNKGEPTQFASGLRRGF